MTKLFFFAAAAMAAITAVPAAAAVTVSTSAIGVVPAGQTVVCDGVTNCGGALSGSFLNFSTSVPGIAAALPGNATSQIAVLGGNTASLAINKLIDSFGLDWGSIDSYNSVSIFGSSGLIGTFSGSAVPSPLATSKRVNFSFSAPTYVSSISFSSTRNSFEFDNVAVNAVPEPATWAMLIAGFALVASTMRKKQTGTAVTYA